VNGNGKVGEDRWQVMNGLTVMALAPHSVANLGISL